MVFLRAPPDRVFYDTQEVTSFTSISSGMMGCGSNTKDIIAHLLQEIMDTASDSLAEDL
jgi:hypothetical protein